MNTGQGEVTRLMREVLGDNYTHLQVNRVLIEEHLGDEPSSSVTCEVTNESTKETFVIAGKGSGAIDAFFNGMIERFATEHPSLETIEFSAFSVEARLDTRQLQAGTDSKGEVTLEITNSEGEVFSFSHSSRSVIGGGIITTLLGMEYFINSERAVVMMYHAIKDARERSRPDLVQRYTNTLATLVRNTSYSEVISRLRDELD